MKITEWEHQVVGVPHDIIVFDDASKVDVGDNIEEHIDQHLTVLKPNPMKRRNLDPPTKYPCVAST